MNTLASVSRTTDDVRHIRQHGLTHRQPVGDGNRDTKQAEVVPVFVEFEVAVPHLRPAWW